MGTILQSQYVSDWLSGDSGSQSFDQVTLVNTTSADMKLKTGTIMSRPAATGKFVQLNPTATDGTQYACCILFDDIIVAAGTEVQVTVLAREALVKDLGLIFPAGITASQIIIAIGNLQSTSIQVIARSTA